ncbi:MAG: hypothetical protein H0W50_01450 [Parachlamydiaceae bacterium]|nr:hypothetical protein [Parachlamydiaceae bacterium]
MHTNNFKKFVFVKNSSANMDMNEPRLINRKGQSVDANYNGKKYRILKTEIELYTLGERAHNVIYALLTFFATFFLNLADQLRQQKVYNLLNSEIRSTILTVTRYHLPSCKEKSEAIINFLNINVSLESLKEKCIEFDFNFNLKTHELSQKKAFLKKIIRNKNIDIIKYIIYKNFNYQDDLPNYLLWKTIKYSIKDELKNSNSKFYLKQLQKTIATLLEAGADFNKKWTKLHGKRGVLDRRHDSILSRYFWDICKLSENFKELVRIQEEILTNEGDRIHYKFYTSPFRENEDSKIEKAMSIFESDHFDDEHCKKNIEKFNDLGKKYMNVINSILNNYHPVITLLLNKGAKNDFLKKNCIAFDCCKTINHIVIGIIREQANLLPQFLKLQEGCLDRQSSFNLLPKDITSMISQIMMEVPYLHSSIYPCL